MVSRSQRFEFCVKTLCAEAVREAVLESEMDQLESEMFHNLSFRSTKRARSTNTPPPLTPPLAPEPHSPYTPPKPQKITLQTPVQPKKKQLTLCQAICATTLEQFPRLIRNPQLLLSLTVQQTLSVQSLLESGSYSPEEEVEEEEAMPGEDVLVSPCSTMICREQIGYDQPCPIGPLENYSDAQVHYDMIPRVEWNVMIPGLQARPCFLKRVKKVPKYTPHYKSRHEEVFARRPGPLSTANRDEGEFIVTSSPTESVRSTHSPRTSTPDVKPRHEYKPKTAPKEQIKPTEPKHRPTLAEVKPRLTQSDPLARAKPRKEVTNVKRDLFEKIVTSLMQHLPTYTRSSVIKLVRDVREKNGGLSGRSTEHIVKSVLEFERQRLNPKPMRD